MQVFLRLHTARHITLDVFPTDTISAVKRRIHGKTLIPAENQWLVAATQVLVDGKTLQDYFILKDSTIHLNVRPAADTSATPPPPPVVPVTPTPPGKVKTKFMTDSNSFPSLVMVPAAAKIAEFAELIRGRLKRSDLTCVWLDGCQLLDDEQFYDYWAADAIFTLAPDDVVPDATKIQQINQAGNQGA
jgi:hypothetical protein